MWHHGNDKQINRPLICIISILILFTFLTSPLFSEDQDRNNTKKDTTFKPVIGLIGGTVMAVGDLSRVVKPGGAGRIYFDMMFISFGSQNHIVMILPDTRFMRRDHNNIQPIESPEFFFGRLSRGSHSTQFGVEAQKML